MSNDIIVVDFRSAWIRAAEDRDRLEARVRELEAQAANTGAGVAVCLTHAHEAEWQAGKPCLVCDRDRLAAEVAYWKAAHLELAERLEKAEAEVAALKEAALDHDCPSFNACAKHLDKLGTVEECVFCTTAKAEVAITRLTAQVASLLDTLNQSVDNTIQRDTRWATLKTELERKKDGLQDSFDAFPSDRLRYEIIGILDALIVIKELEAQR